jgi:hypothetical protein
MLRKLFVDHPAHVGEGYFEHLAQALRFSGAMLVGAIACLVHALVPGLCVRTGSRIITGLHDRMVVNRVHQPTTTE